MAIHYVFEAICGDVFHSQFNAAYLSKLKGEIVFFSNKKHWNYVSEKVNKKINWEEETIRTKSTLSNLIWVFKNRKKLKKDGEIIFLSSDIFIYYRCLFLRLLGYKYIKYVTHADLQNISKKKNIKDYFLFYRRHFFLMKLMDLVNIEVVLLSSSIKSNLSKYIKLNNIETIEHPYLYDKEYKENKYSQNRIKIGFIGLPTEEKGFFWLYKQLSSGNRPDNIEFYLIGDMKAVEYTKDQFLLCFNKNSIINDIDIKNELSKVDYVIFPFPDDNYKLRASGTVFDAINARKPILTTNNSFITEVISSEKTMGIVFDQTIGLEDLYKKISKVTQEEYFQYVKNINDYIKKRVFDEF